MNIDEIIGLLLAIIGGALVVWALVKVVTKKRDYTDNDHARESSSHEYTTETINVPSVGEPPQSYSQNNVTTGSRVFTLRELKKEKENKYSWDETGCVFEINTDGSVTVVGSFDPVELLIDPIIEEYESMIENGLLDMLPNTWAYYDARSSSEGSLFLTNGEHQYELDISMPSIEGIKSGSFHEISVEEEVPLPIRILLERRKGVLILMPMNYKEYILSLGAYEYLKRVFSNNDDEVYPSISTPYAIGGYWVSLNGDTSKLRKVSFAYGENDEYRCCNVTFESGVSEVTGLIKSSVIYPLPQEIALENIAKGAIALSLVRTQFLKDAILLDMLPFPMSFTLKENGQTINVYSVFDEPQTIPMRSDRITIPIIGERSVSFSIGDYELIEDILDYAGIEIGRDGIVKLIIESNVDMSIDLIVQSGENIKTIKIGELIG
ncbi:MAG: hypothetical protein K2K97_09530 [Muribaculaceae bacterium]|nr:hypothetical protein [Muribaculaceae bacterium]